MLIPIPMSASHIADFEVAADMSASGAEPTRTEPDLSQAVWKTSSYSGANGSCVEVADLGEHIAVRGSKDKAGPKLIFTRAVWDGFVEERKHQ